MATAGDHGSGTRDGAILDTMQREFCAGPAARVELNGAERTLQLVQGDVLAMGCCDGVTLHFLIEVGGRTHTLTARVLRYGGQAPGRPETLDLSRLPQGWEVRVDYQQCAPDGCPVAGSLASGGRDAFEGTARIDGESFARAQVSLCLTATAPPSDAPRVLRSVRLFADRVPVLPIP